MNLACHTLAALVLFGFVRRTLLLPSAARRFGTVSTILAGAIAVVWATHPLATSAVTYVIQRAEVMMALFYLSTLYCFARGAARQDEGRPSSSMNGVTAANGGGWHALSIAACWLGMATKEVMATAPFMLLLYDRCFIAGSFHEAWRRRRNVYLALAASWLLLAGLMAGAGSRGGTVGFGAAVSWWEYAGVQVRAIPHYLGLALWPTPLVFDYGEKLAVPAIHVVRGALVLGAILAATLVGVRRSPAGAFPGVAFFAILAPTSSVVPVVSQVMAEHRMYLPLAAVVVVAVLGLHVLLGRRPLILWTAVAVVFGGLTVRRNADYRSGLAIWSDTVEEMPDNARARYNLGIMLEQAGRLAEAVAQFRAVLRLQPRDVETHNKVGNLLLRAGTRAEALEHFRTAVALRPDYADARNNLGVALIQAGRAAEAIEHFSAVVRLRPDLFEAHFNLANALLQANRPDEAVVQYERAVRIRPDDPQARQMLDRARSPRAAKERE
ncbi:MAG: tetratricopeptide repeat protein [Verrucomicrobia bacterium]|nr:tetratricopeptide repeat protein [Verrucomicrobiota bacterium]